MRKSRRVLVLVHPQFHPKRGRSASATEFDVWKALRALDHEVEIAAAEYDLRRFDRQLAGFRPDVVFNLLEEFRGEGVYDFHLITFLESLGIPYTGCNPRGLIVSRHKLWTACIARAHGCPAPESALARPRSRPASFPLLLKFNREHASLGMTRENVVRDPGQLRRSLSRLRGLHDGEVVVQQFIAGQEISVGVWGNQKPVALQPWRLNLPGPSEIATSRVKFSARYRQKKGIRAARVRDTGQSARLEATACRLFELLDMNGYARFDFRVDEAGTAYVIDVNANPCLARTEDFAAAARARGLEYPEIIERIVQLGLGYQPRQ